LYDVLIDILSKLEFLNVEFRIIANNQLINPDYVQHIVKSNYQS